MKTSTLLRAAKLRISTMCSWRINSYASQALAIAAHQFCNEAKQPFPQRAYWRARAHIKDRLGDAHDLQHWLLLKGHVTRAQLLTGTARDKLKATYEAWFADMAEHFEAKGD